MRKTNMKGPKTLDEWIEVYEDRGGDDTEFLMSEGETLVWSPEKGFFTWCLDAERKMIVIPKMVGDGRHWRNKLFNMMSLIRHTGVDRVLACSRRPPKVYQRVLGGELYKVEYKYNFLTKKSDALWFYIISFSDTKEDGNRDTGNTSNTGGESQ